MNRLYKIILNISRSFSTIISSFIISIIGVRYFGKENWGEFIHLFTWITFLAFIANFGNKDYLLRRFSNTPSKKPSHFTTSLISRSLLLSLSIILFFAFPIKLAVSSFIFIIILFIYQSFDSIIIFNQKFLLQLVAETTGFVLILIGVFYIPNFDLTHIIYIYCFTFLIKILIVFNHIKPFLKFKNIKFSLLDLKRSFPFFLIIFSGWISSKMDFYVVNVMMPPQQISEYQIGITSFYLLQSVSYLIILPFNKHLYRLNLKAVKKIKNKVAMASFPIIILGSISIWLVLEKLALLNLPTYFYVIGAIASIPTFFFIVDIIMYYRFKKENNVLKINFILAFLNLILSIFLIEKFGISGALTSMLLIQFIALIIYKKTAIW